jgi:voltage-gated potassium channel
MSEANGRTRHGTFILLRRLRRPLLVLIAVYAVAVLGFTLIPGVAPDGRPWRMSFLHAFYFVSFLGTTIGLGEVPHPFSDAQRLWATASIYGTVVAWLYAIGGLFAVLQDPMFRRISEEAGVDRAVRRMREPFYLLCGYDDTGYRVARELTEDGIRVVVVDIDPARVDSADVDDLHVQVPALPATPRP